MSDIKWIKLTTDMFDNRKIKQIRHLPEGNNIVLIWVMLLTIAGRCNASGMIFLTENIPYTLERLAIELDFEPKVVQLALSTLQDYGMIVCSPEEFYISNWEEYQNAEGLEKIREQTRQRVAAYREKQKQLPCNVTGNVTVTQCNATDKEIDIEKDIEEDIEREKESFKKKTFSNEKVKEKSKRFQAPTVEDVMEYCKESGHQIDAQNFVDYYASNGWMVGGKSHMKDWRAAVRNWERRDSTPAKTQERRFVPTEL